MKTQKINMLLIMFCLFSLGMMARTEVQKEFHEKYATDKNTSFNISNLYGQIDIVNNNSDVMTIDVEVTVEAASEKKAKLILDQINIILANDNNKIAAMTEVEGKGWSGNVNLNINYTISMPCYINTTLENKYGGVEIEDITGHFRAEIKYGSLNANKLVPDDKAFVNGLRLAYCSHSMVREYGKMTLELSYSKLKLDNGNALDFDAKYSDFKIGNVALVKGELAYTDVNIDKALNVAIEAKYSDINIDVVWGSLELETKYGDVDVNTLGKDFDLVDIDAAYSDVDIAVERGAEYKLSLGASYGDIAYPNIQLEHLDDEGNDKSVLGYVGGNSPTKRMMKIETRYGDIDVSEF